MIALAKKGTPVARGSWSTHSGGFSYVANTEFGASILCVLFLEVELQGLWSTLEVTRRLRRIAPLDTENGMATSGKIYGALI